jgi:hypothetical protein
MRHTVKDNEEDKVQDTILSDTCDDGIMPRLAVSLQCFCQVVGSICMRMYLALLMALDARVPTPTVSSTLQVLYR